MDHVCDQCGEPVESGKPFCKHCNAPQIRVIMAEPLIAPALPTVVEQEIAVSLRQYSPSRIVWSDALPATASAGIVGAILMFASRGMAFGLGMMVAGFLAVVLYRRRVPEAEVNAGMGARLGFVCGAWGFALFAIIAAIGAAFARSSGELRAALLEAISRSAARSSDPQAQQFMEYLKTPQGLVLVLTLGLIVSGLAFLMFSSIGGAIAAVLLKRKERG